MSYVPPDLSVLLADDEKLKALLGRDPENDKLILFLLNVNAIIRKFIEAKSELTKDALQTLIGIRLYCLKKIEERKWFLGLYDYDPLHSLLKEELGITKTNFPTPKQEMIYLGKFHNVIFRNWLKLLINHQTPSKILKDSGIDVEKIRLDSIKMLKHTLPKTVEEVRKVFQAPEPLSFYKEKFKNFFEKYKQRKKAKGKPVDNPKRNLFCQFAESFSESCPDRPPQSVDHERAVQMVRGVAFFEAHSLDDEYFWYKFFGWSPKEKSELYPMLTDIIGGDPRRIPLEERIDCIAAMQHMLRENPFLGHMKSFARKKFSSNENELDKYFDMKIYELEQEISGIILSLCNDNKCVQPPTIKTITGIVSLIIAAPIVSMSAASFFALGQQAGSLFSKSNYTLDLRMKLGQGVSYATAYCGMAGQKLGFLAANFWFENSLERLFGKAFEILGLMIGTLTFGTIAVMVDLSFKGLRSLCHAILYLHHHTKLKDSHKLSDEDLEWLQCIVDLPEEMDEMDLGQKMEEILKAQENIGLRPAQ